MWGPKRSYGFTWGYVRSHREMWVSAANSCRSCGVTGVIWGHVRSYGGMVGVSCTKCQQTALAAPPSNLRCLSLPGRRRTAGLASPASSTWGDGWGPSGDWTRVFIFIPICIELIWSSASRPIQSKSLNVLGLLCIVCYARFYAALSSSRSLIVGWSVGPSVMFVKKWPLEYQRSEWVNECK